LAAKGWIKTTTRDIGLVRTITHHVTKRTHSYWKWFSPNKIKEFL